MACCWKCRRERSVVRHRWQIIVLGSALQTKEGRDDKMKLITTKEAIEKLNLQQRGWQNYVDLIETSSYPQNCGIKFAERISGIT